MSGGGIFKPLSKLLGIEQPKALPTPAIPAAPAPTARDDAGAMILTGTATDRAGTAGAGTKVRRPIQKALGGFSSGSGLNV